MVLGGGTRKKAPPRSRAIEPRGLVDSGKMYVVCAIILLSISLSLGEGEFTQSVWPGPVTSQPIPRRSIYTGLDSLATV